MNTDTYKSIAIIHDEQSHWQQPFLLPTDDGQVDLSVAIGKNSTSPSNTSPDTNSLPNSSHYLFDPIKYCGPDSIEDISSLIHTSCHGCSMYIQENRKRDNYVSYQFRCTRYKIVNPSPKKGFTDKTFSKIGCKKETVKEIYTSVLARMNHTKLRSQSKLQQLSKRTKRKNHSLGIAERSLSDAP